MADIENTPVEQLCYTWSDVGLSTVYAGFRIRAASPGLTEIYSERVKSMDRYMRYVLPPGTDRFAITPDMAPVCLAFVRTEWGEYILVHKKYVGEDGVGRLGNFLSICSPSVPTPPANFLLRVLKFPRNFRPKMPSGSGNQTSGKRLTNNLTEEAISLTLFFLVISTITNASVRTTLVCKGLSLF